MGRLDRRRSPSTTTSGSPGPGRSCSPASRSTRWPGRRSSSSPRSPSDGGTASAGSPPSATSTRGTCRRSSPSRTTTSPLRLRYADGALDPATWCAAVATAVERIGDGELAKVVLARDLLVSADVPLDPRRLLRRLAARFPDCWTFAVDGLLGATPELLLRRTGRQLSARVLAGTAPAGRGDRGPASRRGADRLGQGPRRARAGRRLAGPGARALLHDPGRTRRARAAHAGQRAPPGQRRHRHPAQPRARAAAPDCSS